MRQSRPALQESHRCDEGANQLGDAALAPRRQMAFSGVGSWLAHRTKKKLRRCKEPCSEAKWRRADRTAVRPVHDACGQPPLRGLVRLDQGPENATSKKAHVRSRDGKEQQPYTEAEAEGQAWSYGRTNHKVQTGRGSQTRRRRLNRMSSWCADTSALGGFVSAGQSVAQLLWG